MRCNAREIEILESSIRVLQEENLQLKKDLQSSGLDNRCSSGIQVDELKDQIQVLKSENVTLRDQERRLVQEMKQYRKTSFIGVSR